MKLPEPVRPSGPASSTMRLGLLPALSAIQISRAPGAVLRKAILNPTGETTPPLAFSTIFFGPPPRMEIFHRLGTAPPEPSTSSNTWVPSGNQPVGQRQNPAVTAVGVFPRLQSAGRTRRSGRH